MSHGYIAWLCAFSYLDKIESFIKISFCGLPAHFFLSGGDIPGLNFFFFCLQRQCEDSIGFWLVPIGSGVDFLCGFQLERYHIHGLHICQNSTSFPVCHQIPSTVMQGFCLLAEDPLRGVCRFLGGRLWGGEFELLTLGACGVWVYVTLPSVYILLRPDNVGEVLSYTPSMLITLNPRKTKDQCERPLGDCAERCCRC